MSAPTIKPSTSIKKWDQVLNKVRGMLDRTLATADARLQELEDLAVPQPSRLARHLQGLDARLHAAQQLAEETDQALADREKMLRDYLSNIENLRRKLADWASQAKR